MLDKFHILSCTKYQDYFKNIASQTVTMFPVRNSCKPVFCFAFLSGQTDLLQLYARAMSCSRAKLNLFADKRLCNRDSLKCLSVDL